MDRARRVSVNVKMIFAGLKIQIGGAGPSGIFVGKA
jgi:hypothetical protein